MGKKHDKAMKIVDEHIDCYFKKALIANNKSDLCKYINIYNSLVHLRGDILRGGVSLGEYNTSLIPEL